MDKRIPIAEQRRLVALWRESTLTKSAFARAHDVLPVTFGTWVARHAGPETPRSCAFVEVKAVPPMFWAFVIAVGAHTLRFDGPPPPAWFAALLRELAC